MKSRNGDSFNPIDKSFAVSCKVSPVTGTTGTVDQILVRYSGNGKNNPKIEISGSTFVFLKGGNISSKDLCVPGIVQLSDFGTRGDGAGELPKIQAKMEMPGSIISGPTGSPNKIQISLENCEAYKGSCVSVPRDRVQSPDSCAAGYALSLESTCESTSAPTKKDHFSDLCKSVGGRPAFCVSGNSLCDLVVRDLITKRPYIGYRENGTEVKCTAPRSGACVTVGDSFSLKCEAAGGLGVSDCTWRGRECKSLCTLKIP
jgi:hypothetical protein